MVNTHTINNILSNKQMRWCLCPAEGIDAQSWWKQRHHDRQTSLRNHHHDQQHFVVVRDLLFSWWKHCARICNIRARTPWCKRYGITHHNRAVLIPRGGAGGTLNVGGRRRSLFSSLWVTNLTKNKQPHDKHQLVCIMFKTAGCKPTSCLPCEMHRHDKYVCLDGMKAICWTTWYNTYTWIDHVKRNGETTAL